jgi:transposase InsO family protein
MSRGILPDKKPIKPFVKKAPNELWQIDYMEDEPTAIGKVQLVYCLDDYSRSITGGEWFFTKSEGNTLKVLKDAFKNNGLPKAILSDNGSQFKPTSKHEAQTRYQEIMAMLGINTSYSRPYHPQSKGKIERLHSFIQRDFLWEVRDKVRSLEDLNTDDGSDGWLNIMATAIPLLVPRRASLPAPTSSMCGEDL